MKSSTWKTQYKVNESLLSSSMLAATKKKKQTAKQNNPETTSTTVAIQTFAYKKSQGLAREDVNTKQANRFPALVSILATSASAKRPTETWVPVLPGPDRACCCLFFVDICIRHTVLWCAYLHIHWKRVHVVHSCGFDFSPLPTQPNNTKNVPTKEEATDLSLLLWFCPDWFCGSSAHFSHPLAVDIHALPRR